MRLKTIIRYAEFCWKLNLNGRTGHIHNFLIFTFTSIQKIKNQVHDTQNWEVAIRIYDDYQMKISKIIFTKNFISMKFKKKVNDSFLEKTLRSIFKLTCIKKINFTHFNFYYFYGEKKDQNFSTRTYIRQLKKKSYSIFRFVAFQYKRDHFVDLVKNSIR